MFKEGRYLDRVIERQLREKATTAAFMDIYTYLNYWKTAKIESKIGINYPFINFMN